MSDVIQTESLADLAPGDLLDRLSVPSRAGERPGLARIRALLAELGNPHHGLPVLHVGGTSGKGSTATIMAEILRASGYRVGLHVKPHLETVEERFVVDGQPIQTTRLSELLRGAASAARAIRPTWYELTVALALQYFRQERVDLAVVEVGLGGTYDGSNVVEPLVATLTNVGLDHTEILGNTIEKIIADKVGIVKPGCLAVSGVVQPSAAAIVAERCHALGVSAWRLTQEIQVTDRGLDVRGSRFDLAVPGRALDGLQLRLLGRHQVANAAIATASTLRLTERGYRIPESAIRQALASVHVPGRLEILRESPVLLLDGAHNPDKMAALGSAIRALFPGRRVTGVVAFKRGHDLPATVAAIAPVVDQVIATSFDAETDYGRGQAVDPAEVGRRFSEAGAPEVRVEPNPVTAVARALDHARDDDVVCVTGSLYLVGAVRGQFLGPDRTS